MVMPHDLLEDNSTLHRHLHAFCIRPRINFESQQEDEEVLVTLRAHPATQIPWIVTVIFLALLPPFLDVILASFFSSLEIFFFNLVWYSFLASYAFINFLMWLFNVGIITNRRIVDVDYENILIKELTGSSITDVTDVTAVTTGFVRSLFSYGDVFVQTAGVHQNIEFLKVPDPSEVVSIINKLMRR